MGLELGLGSKLGFGLGIASGLTYLRFFQYVVGVGVKIRVRVGVRVKVRVWPRSGQPHGFKP